MTGNFNLKIVYSTVDPTCRWVVRQDNMYDKFFINFVGIHQEFKFKFLSKGDIKALLTKGSEYERVRKSFWLKTDETTKLNVEEYLSLSQTLKECKFKYNKKIDKLINEQLQNHNDI